MRKTTKQVIAENLRFQLDKYGISQTDLANDIGVTPAAVSTWVKGLAAPHADTVDKICRRFGISKEELLRERDTVIATSKSIPLYQTEYFKREHAEEPFIKRYIAVDKKIRADFGVLISSDTMEDAGICNGDVAFFVKHYTYNDGQIYAVWNMKSDAVLVKRVYHQNGFFNLISANNDEAPILLPHNEAILMGIISGIYKEW